MADKFGTPTTSGMKNSLTDFAVGAAGGFFYDVVTAILGSGLIGGLGAAAIAGSMVKGPRGEMIATMLGFQAGMTLISGPSEAQASAAPSGSMVV